MTTRQDHAPLTPAQKKLVIEHLQWARTVVQRLAHRYRAVLDGNDIQQLAHEALAQAARRYDVKRGVPFGGFALKFVRGAVLDAGKAERRFHDPLVIASEGWTEEGDLCEESPEEAVAKLFAKARMGAGAMQFGGLGEATQRRSLDGEGLAEDAQRHARVHAAMVMIPERPREVIDRRHFRHQGIEEIAEDMRLSEITVRRDYEEGIEKLARRLRKAGVEA